MWPSGLVEYKFYDSFPVANRRTVRRAMDYITSKVSCITFREATDLTVDYILIRDGVNMCNSELGRTGGVQVINLSRSLFWNLNFNLANFLLDFSFPERLL